jgi:hypothetical protein
MKFNSKESTMSRYLNFTILIIACLVVSSCATLFKNGNDLYPVVAPDGSVFDKEIKVYLGFPENDVEIHYTADGAEPDFNSPLYKEAITLKESSLIKVRAFRDEQSVGGTIQVKFTKQAPTSMPKRTILFIIDAMNRQMFEKLPLETYNHLISNGVLYKNVANILPLSVPQSKEYYWNQMTSVPPLVTGTALIGTPELDKHMIQHCFTETTALCSNSSSFFSIKNKPFGKGISEGYTITRDLESGLGVEDIEFKDNSLIKDVIKLIETDNPAFISMYARGPAKAANRDLKAKRNIWNRDSAWSRSIVNSDRRLGELISWLEKKGLMKETVIIIASHYGVNDEGACPTYDSGIGSTSVIIYGQGVKKNKVFGYAESVDIMPTICWLNGKGSSEFCQGKVLAEAFEGQANHIRSDRWMIRLNTILCAYKELMASPNAKVLLDKDLKFTEYNNKFQTLNKIGNWQKDSSTLAELVYKNEILFKLMNDIVKNYSTPEKKTNKPNRRH